MKQVNYIRELETKLEVYSHLALAMDAIKHGRVQPANDAFADLLNELEQFKL